MNAAIVSAEKEEQTAFDFVFSQFVTKMCQKETSRFQREWPIRTKVFCLPAGTIMLHLCTAGLTFRIAKVTTAF